VYDTACLDIFVQTGILDTLADSTNLESGLHAIQLQKELDLDAFKLTTVLQYLASQGWVYEKSQNVFALMRPALELRRGRNGRIWSLYVPYVRSRVGTNQQYFSGLLERTK
jgi:hypothetical protein